MKLPVGKESKRGFLLAEVLVVVCVILILLALSVYIHGAACRDAQVCKAESNLRQIGIGWVSYLEEHDEAFPVWSKASLFYRYGGEEDAGRVRPLNRFVPDDEAFRCPADDVLENRADGKVTPRTNYEIYGNSYYGNTILLQSFVKDDLKYWQGIQLNEVTVSPSRLMVAGDVQWYQRQTASDWNAHFHNDDHIVNVLARRAVQQAQLFGEFAHRRSSQHRRGGHRYR